MTHFIVTQIGKLSFIGQKTLLEKEKMLVTHNVFESRLPSGSEKMGLCGTGLVYDLNSTNNFILDIRPK